MKKRILTKYGPAVLSARKLFESEVYVLRASFTFPAGTVLPDDSTLKKAVLIPSGAILLPRWEDYGEMEAKRLHHIFKYGIYEAMRSLAHAFFGYGVRGKDGEIVELQNFANQLAKAIGILMEGKEAGQDELTKTQKELASIAAGLASVINEAKREAREKIALASTLEVSHPSGKKARNLPATAKRLEGATKRLEKRQKEIYSIAPRLAFFEQTLASELLRVWTYLDWLRKMLHGELNRLAGTWTPTERTIFRHRVCQALQKLTDIDAQPFLKTGRLIKRDLTIALRATGGDKTKVKSAVGRILFALRFKDAERALEANVLLPFTIQHDLGALKPNDIERTGRQIKNFMRRLEALDESGFVSPPKERALAHLRSALEELESSLPNLNRFKESLKRASHVL